MKKLFKSKTGMILILAILFTAFTIPNANACEIEFEILKGKKEVYEVGDIIVVKILVTLTHRSCPEALKKTKFKMNGLKVIGATEWKQTGAMDHERKLKIKILGTNDGKLIFNAVRTCDKDGGFGSLKLEAIPLKE
jgi:uncharacterized radical SAM superfamily Fe-S cluster-containing enzyme